MDIYEDNEIYEKHNDPRILGECLKGIDLNNNKKIINCSSCKQQNYSIYVPENTFDFVDNIRYYLFNNILNNKHIDDIHNSIKYNSQIDGVFSVVFCEETDELFLIDGHHRLCALRKLIINESTRTSNKLNQFDITIHLYMTDNVKSKNTLKLYHRLNTLKPFNIDKTIDNTRRLIIDKLTSMYPDCFKRKIKREVQKPFIDIDKFSEKLITKLNNNINLDDDMIVKGIFNINNMLSKKSKSELYFNYNDSSETEKEKFTKYFKKANNKKFYLGTPLGQKLIKEYMNQ